MDRVASDALASILHCDGLGQAVHSVLRGDVTTDTYMSSTTTSANAKQGILLTHMRRAVAVDRRAIHNAPSTILFHSCNFVLAAQKDPVQIHIKYAFASARSEEQCMRPVFVHSFLATMKQVNLKKLLHK